jgi:hypothetical protein
VRLQRLAIALVALLPAACSLFVSLSDLDDGAASDASVETSAEAEAAESGAGDASACAADLTSDPDNCGSCNHSCLGGACVKSACAPFTLTSSTSGIQALACDAFGITFAGYDGSIRRKLLGSSPSITLAPSGSTDDQTLATDDTHAYFVEANQILRVQLDGSTLEPFAAIDTDASIAGVNQLAVDDASVYADYYPNVTDGGDPFVIVSFAKVPSSHPVVVTSTNQAGGSGGRLASDGQTVFFCNANTIHQVPVTGGIATDVSSQAFFSTYDTNVTLNASGSVGWVLYNGGAARALGSTGQNIVMLDAGSGVTWVALDDSNLYAATVPDDAAAPAGTVVGVSLDNNVTTTLASTLLNPHNLVACPGYVAWAVDSATDNTSDVQILAR